MYSLNGQATSYSSESSSADISLVTASALAAAALTHQHNASARSIRQCSVGAAIESTRRIS
jgi:hypothetical protein